MPTPRSIQPVKIGVIGLGRFLAIDCQPSRVHHHLAFALERFALNARDAGGDEEFRCRIKDGKKPFRDEVV